MTAQNRMFPTKFAKLGIARSGPFLFSFLGLFLLGCRCSPVSNPSGLLKIWQWPSLKDGRPYI